LEEVKIKLKKFNEVKLNYTLSVPEHVTTNVTTKRVGELHFCTEQLMAALWSFTCAAVILSLLQENNQ